MANSIRRSSHTTGQPEMYYLIEGQASNSNNVLGILNLGNNYHEKLTTRPKKRTRRARKSYFIVTDVHSK